MMNGQAIEILKEEWRINAELFGKQFGEALNLAIKALEFIDENYPKTFIDYLNWENYSTKLWKEAYEQGKAERPTGEWIENKRYKRKGKKFFDCSVCHYGENGDVMVEVPKIPNFCPNCGAKMKGR